MTEWMSANKDEVRKSPGFDEAMRKVAEDLAATHSVTIEEAQGKIRRTMNDIPKELSAVRLLIADFFRWRAQR